MSLINTETTIVHWVDCYELKDRGIELTEGMEAEIVRSNICYISASPAHYHIKAFDDTPIHEFKAFLKIIGLNI